MIDLAPIKSLTHNKIANMLKERNTSSVLDMGGVGRLKKFIDIDIADANIIDGQDCTKLDMPDNSFDATISVATLEHIKPEKQKLFIDEALRIAKKTSIHWFPVGPLAEKTDALKLKHGHKHNSHIPSVKFIEDLKTKHDKSDIEPFMTIQEHLLLLASIRSGLSTKEIYDFALKHKNKYYGCIWYCDL